MTKPNPENCKKCLSKCAYDSSDNLPSYLQQPSKLRCCLLEEKGDGPQQPVELIEQSLTSHQTHYRSYWGRFLQVIWPNQPCQSTEGSQFVFQIRLESHHRTTPPYYNNTTLGKKVSSESRTSRCNISVTLSSLWITSTNAFTAATKLTKIHIILCETKKKNF